jgi:hypothetical protein
LIGRQLLAAVTTAAAASPVLADVPFATNDPYLIEPGHYEIAASLDRMALPGADATLAAASYDFGLSDSAQVGVAAMSMHADRVDIGEVSANAKFALLPARDGRLALAFGPALAVPLNGTIRHKAGAVLPFYAGVAKGPWSIYGGGGYAINSAIDGGSFPFAGLVASRAVSQRWTLGSELSGHGSNDQSPSFLELGAGASIALGRRFTLAGALYRTLVHREAYGDGRAFVTLRYAR